MIIKKIILAAKKISKNVVICDSFSNDSTIKIARSLDCKIFYKKFTNYAAKRNYIIRKCNKLYDWQLHIDSDEILSNKLIKNINRIVHFNDKNYSYLIKRKVHFLNKKLSFGGSSNWHLRLFPSGTTLVEYINYDNHFKSNLKSKKIKSLIIDHHQIFKPFPLANEIINPNKNAEYNNFNYFCATTLTYFLIDTILYRKIINTKFNIKSHLILVLLATVCDVMPLRGLNRIMAINVLNNISTYHYSTFKYFIKTLIINKKINIDDLGFLIGPILNSGGRLGHSDYATRLLSSNNEDEVLKISNKLVDLNEVRKEIEIKNLGLLVIDEEQRFGVRQKEKIKKIKTNIDVLTLSATPIPRTLYMSLSGLRQMSLLNTPPPSRRSIKTYLSEIDMDVIRTAISQELDRGGQIFYVLPRISDIDQAVNKLGKNLIISGLARDGIIESIESTEHDWCIGVQWHPEFLLTKADKLLISNFIESSQKKL